MIDANWLAAETVQTLGWTLLHFVWQGAALGLLLYVSMLFCASARTRYLAALSTLVLMAACPVLTFVFLANRGQPGFDVAALKEVVRGVQVAAGAQTAFGGEDASRHAVSVNWLGWFVASWFAGVVAFGTRALGGWILLERLRREKIEPVAEHVRRRCHALQQRLALRQRVQYFQSRLLDSPAVIGWFRPVVLLPMTALTGLSAQQLEAVILHELAHIKRLDSFVNLFQVMMETALFYHPAVWWVSRSMRVERENCCDDIAVAICGNAGDYARALALLESWRATPAFAMAATGGVLKARIARLIGYRSFSAGIPRAGLAAAVLIFAASALVAASGFRAAFFDPPDAPQSVAQTAPEAAAPEVAPTHPGWPRAEVARPAAPEIRDDQASAPQTPDAPEPPEPPSTGSYIEDLHSVGLNNLTVDQLIGLKVQGITAEYVRRLHDAGLHPDIKDLIAMKVQGISPEYVRDVRAAGLNPNVLQLIAMKVQGISPEYVRDIRASGLNPNLEELIGLKVQGVSAEYVRALRSAGLKDLSTEQYIAAKVQGITPEFVEKARRHGFTNLSLNKLLALKYAGVF